MINNTHNSRLDKLKKQKLGMLYGQKIKASDIKHRLEVGARQHRDLVIQELLNQTKGTIGEEKEHVKPRAKSKDEMQKPSVFKVAQEIKALVTKNETKIPANTPKTQVIKKRHPTESNNQLSPHQHATTHKEGMKDYKLNNMFKLIEYLEHDQNLVNTKNEYRVAARSPRKNSRSSKKQPPADRQNSRPTNSASTTTTRTCRSTPSAKTWEQAASRWSN